MRIFQRVCLDACQFTERLQRLRSVPPYPPRVTMVECWHIPLLTSTCGNRSFTSRSPSCFSVHSGCQLLLVGTPLLTSDSHLIQPHRLVLRDGKQGRQSSLAGDRAQSGLTKARTAAGKRSFLS